MGRMKGIAKCVGHRGGNIEYHLKMLRTNRSQGEQNDIRETVFKERQIVDMCQDIDSGRCCTTSQLR